MTAEQWASELEARLNGASGKEWRSIMVETIREAMDDAEQSCLSSGEQYIEARRPPRIPARNK